MIYKKYKYSEIRKYFLDIILNCLNNCIPLQREKHLPKIENNLTI